ncbi:septum formation family protein [Nocardioides sp. ChNu-153]|uniref:septum formation family protein n=1 Tax=Nocardioides sp. ChNu-153 TaxID=2779364 RepID=UPI00265925F4|nr:septum formation family protein [Nocardioides sp. ChNu-153]
MPLTPLRAPRALGRALLPPPLLVLLLTLLVACTSSGDQGDNTDPEQVDAVEVPELSACRDLTPADVAKPSNATRTVDCSEPHTAETYKVGTLPEELHDLAYDSDSLGTWAYTTCGDAFEAFLGADESVVMRARVSWAWFRPSEKAWDEGARWYRCDAIGGGEASEEYDELPETAEGLLVGVQPDDRWMTCANGEQVDTAERVACSEPHTWRAVTTVQVGDETTEYPGDRVVEVRSRDYCAESVSARLGYPPDYDYAYTWFGEGQWNAGNRRSICWARTDQ